MLICSRTGRVVKSGQRLRVLTPDGFTDGVLDTVTVAGDVRLRAGGHTHAVALDEVEAVWPLRLA
jgi:hypothetical protein